MARVKYYDTETGTWKYADEKLNISPVQSVNGKTGAVALSADDIGAEPSGAVDAHNGNQEAHPHILALISALEDKTMLKSDISIKKAQLTLEDGTAVLIDVLVASEGTTIVRYTNQVPVSVDAAGDIYNGCGYKNGYRLSSSGVEKEINGVAVTGFIPVKGGDVVRIGGCNWRHLTNGGNNYVCAYDSAFTFIGGMIPNDDGAGFTYGTKIYSGLTGDDTLAVITLEALSNIAYIRVSCRDQQATVSTEIGADMIVTINEEIA